MCISFPVSGIDMSSYSIVFHLCVFIGDGSGFCLVTVRGFRGSTWILRGKKGEPLIDDRTKDYGVKSN